MKTNDFLINCKEFLRDTLMTFFIIVTCVNVAIYILGTNLLGDASLTYDAFLSPIIYGVCGSIPNLVMFSKRELSVKELIIRKVIQLILLEILLVFVAFGFNEASASDNSLILPFCASVFFVYVAVHLLSWLVDSRTAKTMTLDLESFQERFVSVNK